MNFKAYELYAEKILLEIKMKADEKKVLVKKVKIAINGVKSGSPLKDFLDEEDIFFALELLLVTHKALEILKKA